MPKTKQLLPLYCCLVILLGFGSSLSGQTSRFHQRPQSAPAPSTGNSLNDFDVADRNRSLKSQLRDEQPLELDLSTQAVVEEIVAAGRGFESEGRWAEALSFYQRALKYHPDNTTIKQRRSISRIHFELMRRYADENFVKTIKSTNTTEAMNLYSEVLLKIESYHVDNPDWASILRHGLASLEIAISDERFRSKMLSNISDQQILDAVRLLRSTMEQAGTARNRVDAYQIGNRTVRAIQSQLGLPSGIAAFELISGAIVALDTYSAFLSQNQYGETMSQIEGNFVGLGVELNTSNNEIKIVGVIPNGPAGGAEIYAGDKIVMIDGELVSELGSERGADMLRGPEGSTITIQIESPDSSVRMVTLKRRRVAIPSVDSVRMVDPEAGIGLIRITNFQKSTTQDFDAALWKLQRQGMKCLIVDLRGNPGGLLNCAVDLVDRFVSTGVIVSTKGRNPLEDFVHYAKATGTWRVPLVVLVDDNSASASEIFAAAIQDHNRGIIVGEQSYGKGSVQGIFPLNINGAGIRLTTAKFYSPSGRSISDFGVVPQVVVNTVAKPSVGQFTAEDTDAILRSGIQAARQMLN
ncbi:MAG TPA: S41 family peptidase [Pirellulaceae bacterium]|nr:S41 family peptidase [Pirellulaceae bacterium]HMO92008.1 S41 family peptidase [Pirellulaceae bacterium]HMP68807.1 S41 family peptidase [Pirellulaceae bacterium]